MPKTFHVGIAGNSVSKNEPKEDQKVKEEVHLLRQSFKKKGYEVVFLDFNHPLRVIEDLKKHPVDIVFNVCGGIYDIGSLEPHAISILEFLKIPYTGSTSFSLGLCLDKNKTKEVLKAHDIPTAKWFYIDHNIDETSLHSLTYPVIIKPADTHSSIGITQHSIATNKEELLKDINHILSTVKCPALVEEFIEGDEYDICILGDKKQGLTVLPTAKYSFKNVPKGLWPCFSYKAKWGKEIDKYTIKENPAKNLDPTLNSLMQKLASKAYETTGCLDFARLEFRVNRLGHPFVMDVNPNPDLQNFAKTAAIVGMDFDTLVEKILRMAMERQKVK